MVYRTMQGKEIDMEKLMRQHELMPAIGNMKVNARGDELGPGGKIIRKREEVLSDYYEDNPNARVNVAPAPIQQPAQQGVVEERSPQQKFKKSQTGEQ